MRKAARRISCVIVVVSVVSASIVVGCSSSGKKGAPSPRGTIEQRIHQLIPHSVRVRRPAAPGVDPKAGPGGADYRRVPPPGPELDCETVSTLFKDIKLLELRKCVNESSIVLKYRLKRLDVPYLELQDVDKMPDCVRELLPTIAVPREIFFESTEQGPLLCYSARLNLEANELAGFKVPTARLAVKIPLPPEKAPQDDDEMRMLLFSWALAPFWEDKTLDSRIVPDAICNTCLGEKNRVLPSELPQELWP